MPTAYTADIEKDMSFEDFVLRCSRNFGATMHQRDDNMKDKPKLRSDESSYHVDSLSRAKAEVSKLEAMTGVNSRTEYGRRSSKKRLLQDKNILTKQSH